MSRLAQCFLVGRLFLLVFLFFWQTNASAQVAAELRQVTPLSPEAASFTRYGEMPVSYFTGIPEIGIPIYKLQSRELSLDLTLSYHAGGNKVEDIPSWVGMGWSLSGVPSISLSVRGAPDESVPGVKDRYAGWSHDTLVGIMGSQILIGSGYNELYFCDAFSGQMDLEADIYYYTLAGKSGRFYYNQRTGKYQTSPYTNIRITALPFSGGFEIVDDDGTLYRITEAETSQSNSSMQGPLVTNSWFASKICNANRTDSITFNYATSSLTNRNINSYDVHIYAGCPVEGSALSITTISAKNLSSIQYGNGSMVFVAGTEEREDLKGGHALKSIELYDRDNHLKRKWGFDHTYLSSTFSDATCDLLTSSYEKKRLLLNKVIQYNINDTSQKQVYQFEYNTSIPVPCRVSNAQDFWGYFNGSNNATLVPTTRYSYNNALFSYNGANRFVDTAYSQFGILTRMIYPTGGSTRYLYENNEAFEAPSNYKRTMVALQGPAGEADPDPEPGPDPELPVNNTYQLEFVINNPPDYFLNMSNSAGGAFINAVFGDLGCQLNGQAQTCATLTLQGLDTSNSSINFSVTSQIIERYIPNGRYRMKAVFNQNPPQYGGFFFIIDYPEIDTSFTESGYPSKRFAGGLRVKQMISEDGNGNSLNRYFRYTEEMGSELTSGVLFGPSYDYFSKAHLFSCLVYDPGGNPSTTTGMRLTSESNATVASHNGNYVGYKTVFEYNDTARQQGMTRYEFSHEKDLYENGGAFAPAMSLSEFRGKPLYVAKYKKTSGGLVPVNETINVFNDVIVDSLTVHNLKVLRTVNSSCYSGGYASGTILALLEPYNEAPVLSLLAQSKEFQYSDDGISTLLIQKDYTYDSKYRLSEIKEITSKGEDFFNRYYYPEDLLLAGNAEIARQGLITQNRIAGVLKEEKYLNTSFIQRLQTNFKQYGSTDKYFPDEILQKIGSGQEETRIQFSTYSASGNLLSQRKADDMPLSYIFGYGDMLPIAEVKNAIPGDVFYTSFEDNEGNSSNGDSRTGIKSRTGGYSKSLSGLNNGKYILSYWTKSGANWTYVSSEVSVSVGSYTINLSGQIDELRFYPVNSRMTTFTFDPLFGMTSKCEENNLITYYEYDGFGRLKIIRDQDQKILKQFDYQYKIPVNQ